MSKSLVKKSLKILEESTSDKSQLHNEKSSKKRKQPNVALDLMPDNKKLVKFIGKKGQKKPKYELQKGVQYTMVEAKKRLASKKDRTDDNIQKLLRLGKSSLDDKSINKLFGKANSGYRPLDESASTHAGLESAFTEEDFEKFEQEYFCS